MRTTRLSKELLLIAIAGIGLWGCQATTGEGTGGNAGTPSTCGTGGSGGSPTFDSTKPPCDIYELDGGPCVSAHSTIRRLYSKYSGPLYQVRRDSDDTTKDIPLSGDFADSSVQDDFCGDETVRCTISIIYDQSGKGNDLKKSPPGERGPPQGSKEADAKSLKVTLKGHTVYGEHNPANVGYRNNEAKGTAEKDQPQTAYMVVGGDYYNGGCCFDYGNAERNSHDNGEGTMQAVYFGNCTIWNKGDGDGPWIMGDLENGLWAGDTSPYTNNKSLSGLTYITGLVKGESTNACIPDGHWVIKSGNAQSGTLTKSFDGQRPGGKNGRYNPMRMEGAIILGTGGDNSNAAQGNFFEGVMTTHFSSDAADDAVQANIVSVYGN